MALKLNSANGAITLSPEDGVGDVSVTLPRSGIGSVSSLSDLGITATSAELNILDGATVTVTELNYLDGVTSAIQTQLDAKVTSLADLGVTSTSAELNILDGATVTVTEVNYLSGVTSAIQTQLDAKAATASLATVATSGLYSDLTGTPTLATVATTGDYTDLSNTPTIPVAGTDFVALSGGTFTGNVTVTGEFISDSYNEAYNAVTSTTNATTVDCETGNAFSHTLTENTTFTFSNPPASGTAFSFSLEIIQDASASGFTVTWPASVDWPAATAPTLTATASARDVFVFYTRDGGTTWYGFTAGQALG